MRHVQLRAFHHVAICGGFSRAAEELRLTQPAISDQVRKLEEAYDILLFNRHHRQVTLTEAGTRLLAITRRLFDSEAQALDFLTENRALRAGHLRIAADSAHHLLATLATFRQAYPGVQVTVSVGNSQTVLDRLRRYEADVGILGEVPRLPEFEVLRLSAAPIVAFVAKDHPLAAQGGLPLTDLPRWPLVLREQGSKTRLKLEEAARRAGIALFPAIEAEGREAVREIVASGAGVGFVSAAEMGMDPRLVPLALEGAQGMVMEEALVALADRQGAKLVAAFFRIARGHAT